MENGPDMKTGLFRAQSNCTVWFTIADTVDLKCPPAVCIRKHGTLCARYYFHCNCIEAAIKRMISHSQMLYNCLQSSGKHFIPQ